MRVLVCGGRDYHDAARVAEVLTRLHRFSEPVDAIIEGGATGADAHARMWAQENNIRVETYEANWADYGKAAGPIRNALMLTEGRPRCVIAFPGSKGTRNMVKLAKQAGVEVIEIAP